MGLFDLLFNDDESSKNNKEPSLISFLIMNDLEKNEEIKEDYDDFQFEEEELEDDDFFFEDDLDD